jgi:gluconolactonase
MRPSFFVPALMLALAASARADAPAPCDLLATAPQVVGEGFQYTEGPSWSPQGYWVFSDIPANTVYRFDGKTPATVLLRPSGHANGNAFDAQGRLWSARHDRRVSRRTVDGTVDLELADFEGRPLNSPNDLAIARDGAVWFSDPAFGISGYGPVKAPEEQPVRGIYRYKDAQLTLQSGALKDPNGLAFSPDGRLLYAAHTFVGIVRFTVDSQNRLGPPEPWASLPPRPGQTANADGLKVDRAGRVWLAGPQAVGVFDPDGSLHCRIEIPAPHVANLAFGGKDGQQVLVTASDRLWLLQLR